MSTEQIRITRDARLRTGESFRAGQTVAVDEAMASHLVHKGCASYTHRVELLKGALIGSTYHSAGTVVEVSSRAAEDHHVRGTGRVVEPGRLGPLPEVGGPKPPDPEPCPGDPRIKVRFKRAAFYHRRSYAAGDVVEMSERFAVGFVALGLASLGKGQEWTSAGARLLRRCESGVKNGLAIRHETYEAPPPVVVPRPVDPALV